MEAGIWRHYKGGIYQVMGVAEHTETGERLVVYVSLDASRQGPRIRCRPEPMFHDTVEVGTNLWTPRFTYLGNEVPLGQ